MPYTPAAILPTPAAKPIGSNISAVWISLPAIVWENPCRIIPIRLFWSANGETNGLQNLFEDIRFGQIDGVIIEDTIFFGENSTRLTQIIDFFAAHQTRIQVVRETVSCPKK